MTALPSRPVTMAATQMACSWDRDETIAKAEALVRRAAEAGARLILLQELFATPYFCLREKFEHLDLAEPLSDSRVVSHFRALARELGVVLPVSYYERAGQARFNALAVVDADGEIVGTYRKTHVPQFVGYEEKFYFSPGDTGFGAVDTAVGRLGCGICWDQWFPEAARAMALKGAEILIYPTAIGTEPLNPELDTSGHWRRVMQGHAGANVMPLVASNRVGTEVEDNVTQTYYGTSFVAGYTGEILAEADRESETVAVATVDLAEAERYRRDWGVFRDRRPEMYGALRTLDGATPVAAG